MSEYFSKLSPDIQNRYIEKISRIGNYDPYTLKKEDFTINATDLPDVELSDIENYFVLTHSFY